MVASPSSPDRPVRFEIPFRGVIRDVDPPQGHVSTVGYLRVSTDQQSLDQQRDALTAAGYERMFTTSSSGSATTALASRRCWTTRAGDVVMVVVVALDRFGRSLSGTIRTIEGPHRGRGAAALAARGIDYSTATGRMLAGNFAALAAYERKLMHERTATARARPRPAHRTPPKLTPAQARQVRDAPRGIDLRARR